MNVINAVYEIRQVLDLIRFYFIITAHVGPKGRNTISIQPEVRFHIAKKCIMNKFFWKYKFMHK